MRLRGCPKEKGGGFSPPPFVRCCVRFSPVRWSVRAGSVPPPWLSSVSVPRSLQSPFALRLNRLLSPCIPCPAYATAKSVLVCRSGSDLRQAFHSRRRLVCRWCNCRCNRTRLNRRTCSNGDKLCPVRPPSSPLCSCTRCGGLSERRGNFGRPAAQPYKPLEWVLFHRPYMRHFRPNGYRHGGTSGERCTCYQANFRRWRVRRLVPKWQGLNKVYSVRKGGLHKVNKGGGGVLVCRHCH